VPAIRFADGTRLQGSSAILRRLDALAPEPSLRLDDPRVDAAERWGDAVWQPVARRLLWPGLQAHAARLPSFQDGSRLPPVPRPALRLVAPVAGWAERRLNGAGDAAVRADLRALDAHLDRIDGWLADGTLAGAGDPNGADLQIGATTRLLLTIADVRGRIDGRPAGAHARALWPHWPGELPDGALSPWL
jgi:glutathione S-transferase